MPVAHSRNSCRVHSKRWSGCRNCPAGSVSHFTLYSRFGVVNTTVRGLANANNTRSNADSRGGSRCSTTSTTAAASKPSSRLAWYIREPWISLTRSACLEKTLNLGSTFLDHVKPLEDDHGVE